jgi:anti-anti-sigma factor
MDAGLDTDTGAIFYTKTGSTYILKLVGEVRYSMGCAFDDFLDQLFKQQDFDDIVVDLTETKFIDSTNLGLLAKIANFLRARFDKKTTIMSSNEDVNEVLDSVGFDGVFTIRKDRITHVKMEQRLPIVEPCKEELAKTLLETHSLLSGVNDKNRETFKGVVEALQHDTFRKT